MNQETVQNKIDALMKEAFRLFGDCQELEAISIYQKIIDLNPGYMPAYRQKAYLLQRQQGETDRIAAIELCKLAESKNSNSAAAQACTALRLIFERKYDDSFQAFDKAIRLDPSDPINYILKANSLMNRSKFEDALNVLDQVLNKDENNAWAYCLKGQAQANLSKYYEMINCFAKAIEIDPKFTQTYHYKSGCLYLYGDNQEGVKCADICLRSNPNYALALNAKANCMDKISLKDALILRKRCCELNPSAIMYQSNYAFTLVQMGRLEESVLAYNQVLGLDPNHAMALCNRADALNKMGKTEEAVKDFVRVRELVQTGEHTCNLSISNTMFINDFLEKLVELEKTANQTSAQIKEVTENYDNKNPLVSKFVSRLKKLDEEKTKTAAKVLSCYGDNNAGKKDLAEKEMASLKQQYLDLKKQMEEQFQEIKTKVEKIEKDVSGIKDELDNKMDNYHKKLDKELEKLDLLPEDATKLKDYFKAFIGTFSSLFVTAQVVDSGQVSLDANSNKATVLSAIASFAPFVGSFLSSTIKSVGEFLQSREMKTNARKLKNLASDSTELSQLVGSAAYSIVTNTKKQQQILNITIQGMKNKTASRLAKIVEFCKKIGEEADAVLYGKLYKSASAQLGHQDANQIVEKWLNLAINVGETEEAFVRIALGEEEGITSQEANSLQNAAGNSKRSACCTLF